MPNPITLIQIAFSYLPNKTARIIKPNEKLTTFVPVYNDEKSISPTLDSLFTQTRLPNKVYISENGSSDHTREVLEQYALDKKMKFKGKTYFNGANVDTYNMPDVDVEFRVIKHDEKTSKATSSNFVRPLINTDRMGNLDSDIIMSPQSIEAMMNGFYTLHKQKNISEPYSIHEKSIVACLVRSRKEEGTGVFGELSHRIRSSTHDVGQFLIRLGQNKLAGVGVVVSGCGYIVASDDFEIPERTITEDLDLTWKLETRKPITKRLNLEKMTEMGFVVKTKDEDIPLQEYLQNVGQDEIDLTRTNKVVYEKNAISYAITPGTFKGLLRQQSRWARGFQQNLFLYNKDLLKNKTLAVTLAGVEIYNLMNLASFVGLPALLASNYINGHGIDIKTAGAIVGIDIALQSGLLYFGALRRNRFFGERLGTSLIKSFGNVVVSSLPLYMYRYFKNPVTFGAMGKTLVDIIRGKTKEWNNNWTRATENLKLQNLESHIT